MEVLLKMPRISMNMEEGTLAAWRVPVGGTFKEGDVLYEVETEKVTSEYEAPCDGVMLEHLVADGDDVPVDDKVCRIKKSG